MSIVFIFVGVFILSLFVWPIVLTAASDWTDIVWEFNEKRKQRRESERRKREQAITDIKPKEPYTLLIGESATFFCDGDRSQAHIELCGNILTPEEVEEWFREHP